MIQNLLRICIVLLLLTSFIVPAYFYDQLPDEIPIHFNGYGDPDDFGRKSTIWLLPILSLFNLVIIFAVSGSSKLIKGNKKQPPLFPEIVGLYVMLLTTYIAVVAVFVGLGKMQSLGNWFLPFTIGLTVLLVGYILWMQRKSVKNLNDK